VFNCCQKFSSVLWVSSTTAVLARARQSSPPVTFMSLDRSKSRWMRCKCFRSDEEVHQAVHEQLHSQTK
jgi:hypothetical protein